jgi:hypothetical protein
MSTGFEVFVTNADRLAKEREDVKDIESKKDLEKFKKNLQCSERKSSR